MMTPVFALNGWLDESATYLKWIQKNRIDCFSFLYFNVGRELSSALDMSELLRENCGYEVCRALTI